MEKCQFAKDHLFNLNEIQRKTFEHFYKIKKNPCLNCKSNKNVIKIIHSRQSKTFSSLSKLTGVVKFGSLFIGKDNFYCQKCMLSFD